MSRRALLALLALAAFFTAAIPAVAATKVASAPVVKSVRPLKLKLGQRLTIRGSGFIPGRHKDTVVFMGGGKRVVWVKADKASKKTITLILPAKLAALLNNNKGELQPTRLFIRVIAKRSGRAFTKRRMSPVVSPGSITTGSGGNGAGGCIPKTSDPNADTDGDMLPDALEVALGTDPCTADTDGDGVPDGYEYQSALDLNRNANSSAIPWPFPGKEPYPNPLYAGDANTDFDGDSLTLKEEYTASFAWLINGLDPQHKLQTFVPYKPNPNPNNNVMVVAYSDGDQTTNPTAQGNPLGDPTGPPAPANPGDQSPYDVNGDGVVNSADTWGFVDFNPLLSDTTGVYDPGHDVPSWINYTGQSFLTDEEKDIDGDGLTNFAETHGPMSGPGWWLADPISKNDGTYYIPYQGTNWLNADTDGDGIPDGADDQDHDGYTNIEESYGAYIAGPFMAWAAAHNERINVHPFNPCLPNVLSPECDRHPTADYAPFKDGSRPPTWASWPAP